MADGKTLTYSFTDGSVISKLYGSYTLQNGATVSSADKLVTLVGNNKMYYHGSHGITFKQGDAIKVKVAGDATIIFAACQ